MAERRIARPVGLLTAICFWDGRWEAARNQRPCRKMGAFPSTRRCCLDAARRSGVLLLFPIYRCAASSTGARWDQGCVLLPANESQPVLRLLGEEEPLIESVRLLAS